jgi:hypothetical protein
VFDKNFGYTFIIDFGNQSFRQKIKDQKKTSEPAKLLGPDSKEIKAYGNRKMQLDLGTPRNYHQEFAVTNVKWPILGVDFLSIFD